MVGVFQLKDVATRPLGVQADDAFQFGARPPVLAAIAIRLVGTPVLSSLYPPASRALFGDVLGLEFHNDSPSERFWDVRCQYPGYTMFTLTALLNKSKDKGALRAFWLGSLSEQFEVCSAELMAIAKAITGCSSLTNILTCSDFFSSFRSSC